MSVNVGTRCRSGFLDTITTFRAKSANYIGNEKKATVPQSNGCVTSYEDDEDEEHEWDTDLEEEFAPKKRHDPSGVEIYLSICRSERIQPSRYIRSNLKSQSLLLKHNKLTSRELKALSSALLHNTFVTTLDLEDNGITGSELVYLLAMLRENCFIRNINLAENNINRKGSQVAGGIIRETRSLETLTLKGNKFQDKDAVYLAEAIAVSERLRVLDLSHNSFRLEGGKYIGMAIQENATLYELDLSWNHFRMSGAVAIAKGLKCNTSIKTLNLAFNGFADQGAEALGKALEVNNTLESLDITYNRISNIGAKQFSTGLAKNATLQVLKIGYNPITSEGVYHLLTAVQTSESLSRLQMNDIVIDAKTFQLVTEMQKIRPNLYITHGGVSNGLATGEKNLSAEDFRKKIFDLIRNYLSEKKLRMLDLFNQWDKDKSLSLTADEFEKGMKAARFPLSGSMIKFLLKILDVDGSGEVEYSEFLSVSKIE